MFKEWKDFLKWLKTRKIKEVKEFEKNCMEMENEQMKEIYNSSSRSTQKSDAQKNNTKFISTCEHREQRDKL